MIRSLQCLVSGKVQRVFYRAWVSDQAQALGLKGWVRNLGQNQVEVLIQGDEKNAEELRRRLLIGPETARVDNVEAKWIDYDTEHDGFQIRT